MLGGVALTGNPPRLDVWVCMGTQPHDNPSMLSNDNFVLEGKRHNKGCGVTFYAQRKRRSRTNSGEQKRKRRD